MIGFEIKRLSVTGGSLLRKLLHSEYAAYPPPPHPPPPPTHTHTYTTLSSVLFSLRQPHRVIAELYNFSPNCITRRRLPLDQKRRYRWKTSERMLKTPTLCNRWKIVLFLTSLRFVSFDNTTIYCKLQQQRQQISESAPKVAYFCNFFKSLVSESFLLLNNYSTKK